MISSWSLTFLWGYAVDLLFMFEELMVSLPHLVDLSTLSILVVSDIRTASEPLGARFEILLGWEYARLHALIEQRVVLYQVLNSEYYLLPFWSVTSAEVKPLGSIVVVVSVLLQVQRVLVLIDFVHLLQISRLEFAIE